MAVDPRRFTLAILAFFLCLALATAEITSLTLVNADTNDDIGPLTNGQTLVQSELPSSISVRANVDNGADTAIVEFFVNGEKVQTESKAPYAIKGDSGGSGDYYTWNYPTGTIELSVKQTLKSGATDTLDITFEIGTGGGGTSPAPSSPAAESPAAESPAAESPAAESPAAESPAPPTGSSAIKLTVVDAGPDTDFGALTNGAVIGRASWPDSVSIRADVNKQSGSNQVKFYVGGTLIQTENVEPYAIKGDSSGNYVPWTVPIGETTLKVEHLVGGTVFDTLTVAFTVQEGTGPDPTPSSSPGESAAPTPGESAAATPGESAAPTPGTSVVPTPGGGATEVAVNFGSTTAVGEFVGEDLSYITGTTSVSSGAGEGIYASHRWAKSFGLDIPLKDGTYDVELFFLENYDPNCKAGGRVMDITVGSETKKGIDVFAKVGCTAPYTEVFSNVEVTGSLKATIAATVQNAFLSGIRVSAGGSVDPSPDPSVGASVAPTPSDGVVSPAPGGSTFAINMGANTKIDEFIGDDGTTYVSTSKTSGGAGTGIYATHRWGNPFTVTIPLEAGTYDVQLHFLENFEPNCNTGNRVMNINVGGTQITGLDVFAKVGCTTPYIELVKGVEVTGTSLEIVFAASVQNAFISGIKVAPTGTLPDPTPGTSPVPSGNPSVSIIPPSLDPVPSPEGTTDKDAHAVPPVYDDPIVDLNKDGFQFVNMDGTGSHTHYLNPDTGELATLVNLKWTNKDTGDILCEGPKATVCGFNFPLGTTMVELCVKDSAGFENCAETTVTVVESISNGIYCYYYDFSGATGTTVPLKKGLETEKGATPKPLFGAAGTDVSFPNLGSFPDFSFSGNSWAQRCIFFFDTVEEDTYEFTLKHTGGVAMYVGEELVVSSPASSTSKTSDGTILIPEGLQQIDLIYYKTGSAAELELSYNATAVTFKYDIANLLPIISSVTPDNGKEGTFVKITGQNFDEATEVFFGGAKGANIKFVSSTSMTALVPAITTDGSVDITVSNLAGVSNGKPFTVDGGSPPPVKFTQASFGFKPDSVANIAIGPDFKYYMATTKSKVIVADVDHENNYAIKSTCESDNLGDPKWKNYKNGNLAGRTVLGIAFNPKDTTVKAYIATSSLFWGPNYGDYLNDDYAWANGNIELLEPGNGCLKRTQFVVTGLPVSNHDHSVNSLVFDQGGDLHFQIGGFTNQGIPGQKLGGLNNHPKWGDLDESPISAASVVAKLSLGSSFNGEVTYDNTVPALAKKTGGDVDIYATGFRNSYGLALFSNGKFYATDNGPNNGFGARSISCTDQLPDKGHGDKIVQMKQGKYYGSPNRPRGECIFVDDNGKVASGDNPPASANFDGPIAKVSASTNGIMEYTAHIFGGALKGDLFASKYAASGNGLLWQMKLKGDGTPASGVSQFFSFPSGLSIVQGHRGEIIMPQVKKANVVVLKPDYPTPASLAIIAVTPFRGGAGGGNQVLITGHNFGSSPTATIGGKTCTSVTDVTETSFKCTTPSGTGLVDVEVTSGGASAAVANAFWYMNV